MNDEERPHQKVVKFALVGLVGTALDFVGFYSCLSLGLDPIFSRGVGYLIGTLWAFFLNSSWVFNSSSGWTKIAPFSITYLFSGSVAVFIQTLGPNQSEPIGLVLSTYATSVLVAASLNYFSLRYLVFRD
jgi:putative flippase GtrA